jgi:rubrerythrin
MRLAASSSSFSSSLPRNSSLPPYQTDVFGNVVLGSGLEARYANPYHISTRFDNDPRLTPRDITNNPSEAIDEALRQIDLQMITLRSAARQITSNNDRDRFYHDELSQLRRKDGTISRLTTQVNTLEKEKQDLERKLKMFEDAAQQRLQAADDAMQAEKNATAKCCICTTSAAVYVITPCGHLCLCTTCKEDLKDSTCPICRQEYMQVVKVYS